jgi:arylsulfatase A-like enzyme
MLADFFNYLDKRIGMDNVLVVLTADHGFPNTPEFAQTQHYDAQRIDGDKLMGALDKHLEAKFGVAKLVQAWSLPNIHLDYALAEQNKLKREEVETAAARLLAQTASSTPSPAPSLKAAQCKAPTSTP